MQYKTVHARSRKDLDAAVNHAIFHGWKPLGGGFVAPDDPNYLPNKYQYLQTMVKETEKIAD